MLFVISYLSLPLSLSLSLSFNIRCLIIFSLLLTLSSLSSLCLGLILILGFNVTNPWVELIIENWLANEGCARAYKHMIKDHNTSPHSAADVHDGSL